MNLLQIISVMFALHFALAGCSGHLPQKVDVLISGGLVYTGDANNVGFEADVGIADDRIVFIGDARHDNTKAKRTIDATGMIVAPGFIDPHTHTLNDLFNQHGKLNENYLTQGVTTVLTGNDGGGPIGIRSTLAAFAQSGVGTNVGLFVGHGTIRKAVIGGDDRPPTDNELDRMRAMVRQAMESGALGLSSGLYYAPGSFADTEELIELSKVAAQLGGVYETHIRDESSYSIGLLASIDEAIEIGRESGAPVHIAHIKALGVDVWGTSEDVIAIIEEAQASGLRITADQYPWSASGTRISNALIPNWAKAGSIEEMFTRLRDQKLSARLRSEITENLYKRGGANALLIVSGDKRWIGKTLDEIARDRGQDAVSAAIDIVLDGDARVASFNMQESDIEAFMGRMWVASSSDGTKGHPRKYGSFPRKYRRYVVERNAITLAEFVRRSTGFVAEIFSICGRGVLREDYFADVVVFDPKTFRENATFADQTQFSSGVNYLFVNGSLAIDNGVTTKNLAGRALQRGVC